jgi:ribosome-binding protein aMBF1 (putative translation factor)
MNKNDAIKKKLSKLTSFDSFLKQQLKDPEFKKEYLALGPEFDLIHKMIEKRIKRGLTQRELAKKLKTKQSAISRFESGRGNPTVNFLYNIADALGIKIKIQVVR